MELRDGLLAQLIGHPVEIGMQCGCKGYRVVRVEWVIERVGLGATLAEAERRLICRKCGERPRLELGLQWGVGEGRDRRPNPPPLPIWARDLK